ncbi:MAG: adenylyl-sulfate kinase [Solirubrobacterales bacterium]|nr:adenylyl-sulfate kinase [Solirubrobacterales bacterium]
MARGATVWLTGLPAAGKTTIGDAVAEGLDERGYATYRLDGDVLRRTLSSDLGFDAASRQENIRRAATVAGILAEAGVLVIVSLISPYRSARDQARELHARAELPFLEVYLDTPLAECERRDPRGLYAQARRGEITGFTGVDDPYDPPQSPEVTLHTEVQSIAEAAGTVLKVVLALDLARALRRGATRLR